jgi:hypothetical protein
MNTDYVMHFVKRFTIILVSAVFLLCTSAQAEINGADTLEWLACASEVIAVGQITRSTTTRGDGGRANEEWILRVTEMIKGPPAREISFRYQNLWNDDISWIRRTAEPMVLLSRAKSDKDWDPTAPAQEKPVDLTIIDLSATAPPVTVAPKNKNAPSFLVPTTARHPFSVLDLQKPPPDLFNGDGRRLTSRDEILAIARTWSKSPITAYLDRNVDPPSDAFEQLYSGSVVLLRVPAEQKYRAELIKLARFGIIYRRSKAVEELAKYPGAETEKLLRSLLNDTSEQQQLDANDVITTIRYPVREAAYKSLEQLGVNVPEMPFERAPKEEEQRQLRGTAWRSSFQGALQGTLPSGWKVFVGHGEGKSIVVEELGNPVKTQDLILLIVDIVKDATRYSVTLVPVEWPRDEMPLGRRLGTYSKGTPNARIFLCTDTMPQEIQAHFIRYYHLEHD